MLEIVITDIPNKNEADDIIDELEKTILRL